MANIYDLSAHMRHLQMLMEECGSSEEAEKTIAAELASVTVDFEQKADGYARVMKNMQAYAEAIKAEEDRLYSKRKSIENSVARMKRAILDSMLATGQQKIKTTIGEWRVQQNPWRINILNAEKVPARFLIEQPPAVDKTAMLSEFKNTGELFDGVEFVRDESIRFM